MARIIFLPGIAGSRLAIARPGFFGPPIIWPDGYNIANGELRELQLDITGLLPGPLTSGLTILTEGVYLPFYKDIIQWLTDAGHTVFPIAYDWRLSLAVSANRTYALIGGTLNDPPYVILTHSMGGLIAKMVYALLRAAGQASYVSKIIQLGTPNYGSWSVNNLLWRTGELYDRLLTVQGYGLDRNSKLFPAYLDAVIASWPSVYELMPFRNAGPLFADNPALAASLYDIASYAGANPFITATRLLAAPGVQDGIQVNQDSKVTDQLMGVNHRTLVAIDRTLPVLATGHFTFTQQGDGTVTFDQSKLPFTQDTTFPVNHNQLVLNLSCLQKLYYLLQGT